MRRIYPFFSKEPIVAGQYLAGHYSWPRDIYLVGASAIYVKPSAVTTIRLMIDGVPSGKTIVLSATAGFSVANLGRLLVTAGQEVRLQVLSGPTSGAAEKIGITLNIEPAGTAVDVPVDLRVRWVDGLQRMDLFAFDPGTHQFTECRPGISTGRATLTNSGDITFSATIQGTEAFKVTNGAEVKAIEWVDDPRVALTDTPRLEFWDNGTLAGTLTKTGFKVNLLDESTPVDGNRFTFYGGGVLAAALDKTAMKGLVAVGFEEPL